MLEVSDVEHRDNDFYVRVMANTIYGTETASLTKRVLVRGSLAGWSAGEAKQETKKRHQTPVQDAILDWETVCGCVQLAMGYLKFRKLDYILRAEKRELQFFYHFWVVMADGLLHPAVAVIERDCAS